MIYIYCKVNEPQQKYIFLRNRILNFIMTAAFPIYQQISSSISSIITINMKKEYK
jgi:hypothetical protein